MTLKVKKESPVHPTICDEGSEEGQMYSFSICSSSALDGGGWSGPSHSRFSPLNSLSAHCTGGWEGLRAGLDW